jgi:hypothetical protein
MSTGRARSASVTGQKRTPEMEGGRAPPAGGRGVGGSGERARHETTRAASAVGRQASGIPEPVLTDAKHGVGDSPILPFHPGALPRSSDQRQMVCSARSVDQNVERVRI